MVVIIKFGEHKTNLKIDKMCSLTELSLLALLTFLMVFLTVVIEKFHNTRSLVKKQRQEITTVRGALAAAVDQVNRLQTTTVVDQVNQLVDMTKLVPQDAKFTAVSQEDSETNQVKEMYYLYQGNLWKVSLNKDESLNVVERTVINVDSEIIKMEKFMDYILLHTSDNQVKFLDNNEIKDLKLPVGVVGMVRGALIGTNGNVYHLHGLGNFRFPLINKLASELNVNIESFQEIRINNENGELWLVGNTEGIVVSKLKVA